jgi:hypothetical protein
MSLLFFLTIALFACNIRGSEREDNIKMDLQEVGGSCRDWMELAQDRDR